MPQQLKDSSHWPSLVFLSKTHSLLEKVGRRIRSLSFSDIVGADAEGKSDETALAWTDSCWCEALDFSSHWIHVKTFISPSVFCFISFVYGSSKPYNRPSFWECLGRLGSFIADPWLMLGDFNHIVSNHEKISSNECILGSQYLLYFMASLNLIDLIPFGLWFT